ncbi:MAG: hypothetical protein ACNS62_04145 [Candidatus Cyclobacteriaceae bacterium M3_2C_046]
MAKPTKKNTLSDLSSFLKEKSGAPAAEQDQDFLSSQPHSLVEIPSIEESLKDIQANPSQADAIISQIILDTAKAHGQDARQLLFKVIQRVLDDKPQQNASDVMLQNMVLYLSYTEEMAQGYRQMKEGD